MKVIYFEHIKKWVVRKNGGYLEWCGNLAIYLIGTAHTAKKFKTEEEANTAIIDYKKTNKL